jgi:hypothetical protein
MKDLIAIDPGVHEYGWAMFVDGLLSACGVAFTEDRWRPGPSDISWICEYPEQRGKLSPVKVQTLIDLALAAGRIVGSRPCEFYRPMQWKGNIDKKPHHNAMLAVLEASEALRWEAGAKTCTKDTLLDLNDAVCLGLWRLGRL